MHMATNNTWKTNLAFAHYMLHVNQRYNWIGYKIIGGIRSFIKLFQILLESIFCYLLWKDLGRGEMALFVIACYIILLGVQLQGIAETHASAFSVSTEAAVKFTNILIDKLTTDLVDIAHHKQQRHFTYKANDVAAIQAVRSLEKSLFQLSAYYAQNRTSLIVKKYLGGLAFEFATTRCDAVISNRFPRTTTPLPSPWNTHKDYLYYDIDCRRNATDISSNKYKSLHAEIRVRRSLPNHSHGRINKHGVGDKEARKRRSVNDPSVCGSKVVYEGLTGNLTSPGYPSNYSAGISCVWHIKLPVKYAVQIQFDMFHFEHDKKCLFDSLEFFDGSSTKSKSIGRFCGTQNPATLRSSMNILTIRMTTDNTFESYGFALSWNYTEPNYPHPGFLVTSNIIVDQLGQKPNDPQKFDLVFNKPTTCSLKSQDVYCYFQYEAFIITRIISTTTLPAMKMNGRIVEVTFDHIVDLKSFPKLYDAKKYCMRWNDTIRATDGAWTRYGGKIYRSDTFSTTCHFEQPGIFAVIAEHRFQEEAKVFRFTGSFYAGIFFSTIWLILLICQWAFSRRINVPEWINFNQALSLVLFLGIVLCGLHLHFDYALCSLLAFLLYYFGLGVFFWQFLKAAQLSGKFDDFFARGRNIYIFYFLLGWTLPMFIAGMAGGAMFYSREATQSCWLALVGGSIWGYTSPTYFLVLANLLILYKVSKKTKKNLKRFNHPELRKRLARELLQLTLFVITWVFGVLCALNRTTYSLQYMFCLSITLSVLLMSLGAKQRRPGYQKIHYIDLPLKQKDSQKDKKEDEAKNEGRKSRFMFTTHVSMKAYKKWRKFKKYELKIAKSFAGPLNRETPGFKAYEALEEDKGSKSSLRTATSLRSESVLSSAQDEQSDVESELQLSSSNEDEASYTSEGSRVEVKADVIGNPSRQSRAASESHYQMNDQEDDEDDEVNHDEMEREENSSPAKSEGRNSSTMLNVDEGQHDDDQNVEEPGRESRITERGRTSEYADVDENQEEIEEQGEDENTEEEDRQDTSQNGEQGEEEAEEQDYFEDIPQVTVNAFASTPIDDGSEIQEAPQRSPLPMRANSSRKVDEEVISVCSLGEEDEDDTANDVAPDFLDPSICQ